jgi:hypothetical protein
VADLYDEANHEIGAAESHLGRVVEQQLPCPTKSNPPK